jgi:membrane-associated phospholipid phosphatase
MEVDAPLLSQKQDARDASADAGAAGGSTNEPLVFDALPGDGGVGWPGRVGVWPREFPKAGPWDVAAVSAFGVGTVVLQVTYTPATVPHWSGGILLDDWARRVLRLSSPTARAAAAQLSNGLLYVMAALPFVDAWLGAGFTYKRTDVALRLTLLDAEALLATTFITLGGQHLVLRARPFVSLCAHQPTASECTDGSAQDTSFPSGHTSIAFAVAMLECVNHAHLDTDRSGWNGIVCPLTMSVAGFTGLLRIVSDRHFLSDVLVGGLLGAGIGYAVPTLHFAVTSEESKTAIIPVLAPGYAGLALSGAF